MFKKSVLFITIITIINAANILDILSADLEERVENQQDQQNCICNGKSCICCVDFNMTYIDLGGPGCVRLNYLSKEEGIAVNVSFGDSLLHNQIVKGPESAPTCITMFAKFAQICARFNELLAVDDGFRGCLKLEPILFGEVQLDLPLGCFRMASNKMEVIRYNKDDYPRPATENTTVAETVKENDSNSTAPTDAADDDVVPSEIGGISTADIIAVVNESADQGLAFLSNWLGFNVKKSNETETDDDEEEIKEKPT